jgi:hypothetical protein
VKLTSELFLCSSTADLEAVNLSFIPGIPTHVFTSFSEITMTGYKESVVLWWEIRRNVANDAYGENARLLEFDIHYQVNKQGTFSEIPS